EPHQKCELRLQAGEIDETAAERPSLHTRGACFYVLETDFCRFGTRLVTLLQSTACYNGTGIHGSDVIGASIHYCTNYMDVHAKYTSMFNATVSDIGDMCISRCHSGDNQFVIMVAVYISPNNYHKPIVSVLEIGDDDAGNDDGERVVEIMNES
ncbi:hypothetical protein PV325_009734, partial [Microctonus aethiopoides]